MISNAITIEANESSERNDAAKFGISRGTQEPPLKQQ